MKWERNRMKNFLENERMRLRAPEPEDLECLYRWENDSRLWEYGSTLSPFSKHALRQYIQQSDHDIYRSSQLRLMITIKPERTVVGTIDLYDFDPHHRRAGVGILIDAEQQHKGFAGIALQLVADYADRFLHVHQLYAHVPKCNAASIRLFERSGFVCAGTLKAWNVSPAGREDVLMYQRIFEG